MRIALRFPLDAGNPAIIEGICAWAAQRRGWRFLLPQAATMTLEAITAWRPDGIIALPDHKVSFGGIDVWETLTFEFCDWQGYASMLAGIRLAQVKMVEQMAEHVGDTAYAAQCRQWYAIGAQAIAHRCFALAPG